MPNSIHKRPSHKELTRKIGLAAEAARQSKVEYINMDSLLADVFDLDLTFGEVPSILVKLLEQVQPCDYRGHRPPQCSYETKIGGLELFPFTCDSAEIGKTVYFKFALKNDTLYLVSFHEDRPQEE